ncbi:SCP2 sterol-binding domain-containing protein [Natronospirillum operosum]|uniref:SCP2 sterol-binding domain-containing protein n=1 Tax=Natronospirillum operosum TaxID=2759953 RepID=A0A4Z0WCH3_9GAMM|nr:SCP2 sterol-binding domain-containing protein [Natronospirillum operosum]TGG95902.1 SCP2 sterol-binding domain-containing protein [Natronospirillum operosum]
MSTLHDQFAAFESRFNASAAADMEEIFQFDVDGNHFHLVIDNGQCTLKEGEHDDPSVTLRLTEDTLQALMSGGTNGMQAFMAGDLKVEGNMMLATQLSSLFDL